MNKLANVIFAYSPKNDDELELTVGDKIEVIGFEEEGWWRGRLKGRIGVFPSNFVQVIETGSPSTQTSSKLNSIFGSKVSSKNSISSNSLNTINNNSSNGLNNNNSNSNNNLIMNNTQHEIDSTNEYPFTPVDESLHSSTSSSERRPKPIRGVGYGDIFAAGAKAKPLPADPTKPTAMASERLSTITSNLASTLQKPIPKKPPPPAPANDIISNGSSSDLAPALPPKPSNQFSSYLQQHSRPLPPPTQHSQSTTQQREVREQARVIYAYKPSNDDELAMEVGDIINVIDKDIEDAGWWKGELNGKVGVFPDNFVELITVPGQDWPNNTRASNASQSNALGFTQQQQQQPVSTEGKIKSVFASTPKGFSKELENNLEKHNNPASFLSLKRNKLQQQMSLGSTDSASAVVTNDTNNKHETDVVGPLETNSTKLNHITANRAKGPTRRPPSNILSKRSQTAESIDKRESNGKDEFALGSLPVNSTSQPPVNLESLSSLPVGQHTPSTLGGISGGFLQNPNDVALSAPIKPSTPLDNVENHSIAPKTSQRTNQSVVLPVVPSDKGNTAAPTRPPWMVELRKSNLEKKRETTSVANQEDDATTPIIAAKVTDAQSLPSSTIPQATEANLSSPPEWKISKNVTSEISELRDEVKRLQEDFKGVSELKSAMEAMKAELKACQSAIENQKRYIKELVNNLADERKKIAAMQGEIERNLK